MGIIGNLVAGNQNNQSSVGDDVKPIELTDETFTDQTKSGITFIDFWAEWCGPCKMVAPTIDKLAQKWQGKVKFAKLNIDDYPLTPGNYKILSIPTFYIMVNGEVKDQLLGAVGEQIFDKFINDNYEKYGMKS